MASQIEQAADIMRQGGVVAYPTEYCFGLGCDPQNSAAVQRILQIKNRDVEQGVLLIAADLAQIERYANLPSAARREEVLASWPGPTTWLLPMSDEVPDWIHGKHQTIAMRLTAHTTAAALCREFGAAIVSTSANRHGHAELLSAGEVQQQMGEEVDFIIDAPLGDAKQPSQIRDAQTGESLR